MHLQAGALLKNGEYKIEKVLGQGGFGITYLAEQTSLGRKVAIKEFFMKEHCERDSGTSYISVPSSGSRELVDRFRQKFIKEARLIASFENMHIVRVTDVFEENGTAYYVMEYLNGTSLEMLVRERGPLAEAEAVKYIINLSDALAEVHAHNFLHLDVKPANVMLNKQGEAVLIDFGISKHYDDSGSQTSSALIGISEGYAPLEQYETGALDNFTPPTDIYALGATLFFLLTGKRPPKASEVMNYGLPELPSGVSKTVRDAVAAAMQPTVRMRPASVKDFVSLLSNDTIATSIVGETEILGIDSPSMKRESLREGEETVINNGRSLEKNKKGKGFWIALLLLLVAGTGAWLAMSEKNAVNNDAQTEADVLVAKKEKTVENCSAVADQTTELPKEPVHQERPLSVSPVNASTKATDTASENIANSKARDLNGHEYVDLGLSVKWATCNVGATKSEEYGGYYAWGETENSGICTWRTYKWCDGSKDCMTKYCKYSEYGKVDKKSVLDSSDDVARVKWGAGWRMPKPEEIEELLKKCSWQWSTLNGVNGYNVVGPNGKSIFLPAGGYRDGTEFKNRGVYGYYWSNLLFDDYCYMAKAMFFDKSNPKSYNSSRNFGHSVRPVCK